jgi:hypothetical protein
MNRSNLGRELADLTKYVFSMWEWAGFTPEQMLEIVNEKSNELEIQYLQDFLIQIKDGIPVVITDLDGTVGDWRSAFRSWLSRNSNFSLPEDVSKNLAFEIDAKMPYPQYTKLKEQFEASGGYSSLPFYSDAVSALLDLDKAGCVIMAYTARPARYHTRIWSDTWNWIKKIGLGEAIDELRIGAEDRINRAYELLETGHKVVLFEDDPSIALRAAFAGIQVFLRNQPYNAGISHDKIIRVDKFNSSEILRFL